MHLKQITTSFLVHVFIYLLLPPCVHAQEHPTFEATILEITTTKAIEVAGQTQLEQTVSIRAETGTQKNQTITFHREHIPPSAALYKPGHRVIITQIATPTGEAQYVITDFVRRDALFFLTLLFIGLVLFVARKKGVMALLGLTASFVVIFYGVLPLLSQGWNPMVTAIGAAVIIIPLTFYLSHGVNAKTTLAILGTLTSLVITGTLAMLFTQAAHLTGFASEEANFIQSAKGLEFDIRGLLLAGIIIGTLGILDDITISQSAIVLELKRTAPHLSFQELYTKAIGIGHDHIASLVNTLILVYTGAALPLLLLFSESQQSFSSVINYEIIAEEIIRTLVSSIGLILAVPITTMLTCAAVNKKKS